MMKIFNSEFHPAHPLEPTAWYEIRGHEIFTSASHPTHPSEPKPWFFIILQEV